MNQLKLDEFVNYKFISGLSSNPSQNKMAFAVAKADMKKNDYAYDLYVYQDTKNQKITSLKNNGSFIWASDDCLLFPLAKNKTEEKSVKEKYSIYYRYDLNEKKLEKAYTFKFPASIIKVLNPNQLLLSANLTREEHHLYLDQEEERKAFLKAQKKNALYEDIDEIPFYFNGAGFVANRRNQLFIYDIKNDRVKNLVDTEFNVGIVKVSKDLKRIYYTGKQMTGIRDLKSDVYCYHVDQDKNELLYRNDTYALNKLYLFEDQVVLVATDMKTYGLNQNDDFYVLKNHEMHMFNPYRQSIENSVGTDARLGQSNKDFILNQKLYFVTTIDDHTELHALSKNGQVEPVYVFDGSLDGLCVMNQKVYAVGLYKQKLQEIYELDLESHTQKSISRFNQNSLKNIYVAKPRQILIKKETHEVKGWVLLPKDYDSNRKYPAILDIHGGPKTVYGKVFYHEMQYWANQGYFVFFANPKGSDGKGDAFSDIRGKYGTIDYEDLMNFTDKVLKQYHAIDEKRVFVTGGSYGGFMTNWIVGHTDRFKAAATQRSISNWLSFHGTSDIGFYFSNDQTGGRPNEDTEKLWEQSPMKYALNIKTPLLFIHSDQDYRCPIEQAMQLYTIVKERGIKTKLVWFKGETHELSRSGKPEARIKRLSEITQWFDAYK